MREGVGSLGTLEVPQVYIARGSDHVAHAIFGSTGKHSSSTTEAPGAAGAPAHQSQGAAGAPGAHPRRGPPGRPMSAPGIPQAAASARGPQPGGRTMGAPVKRPQAQWRVSTGTSASRGTLQWRPVTQGEQTGSRAQCARPGEGDAGTGGLDTGTNRTSASNPLPGGGGAGAGSRLGRAGGADGAERAEGAEAAAGGGPEALVGVWVEMPRKGTAPEGAEVYEAQRGDVEEWGQGTLRWYVQYCTVPHGVVQVKQPTTSYHEVLYHSIVS